MDKDKAKTKKPAKSAEKAANTPNDGNSVDYAITTAKLSDLIPDDKNFNKGTEFGQHLIEKSLRENGAGRSILLDKKNRIIAGNKTTEKAAEIDLNDVIIVETDGTKLVAVKRTDIDLDSEQGRQMALADNATSAANLQWDEDQLRAMQKEMDNFDTEEWGIHLEDVQDNEDKSEEDDDNEETNVQYYDRELNPEAEKLLDEAMRDNAREFLEMLEYDMQRNWLPRGITEGYCQAQFLKAKYYGVPYKSVYNLYFQPKRFLCASGVKNNSLLTVFKGVSEGKKRGLAGLRTATADGNIAFFYSSNYPIAAAAAAAAEFPPEIARQLYSEFCTKGRSKVLDPCHGWGGRLVGALLADVESYTGVDPSNDANEGVVKIAKAFGIYGDTKINIIQKCFEDTEIEDETFDFALTSPPYFDVEKYEGENTSHRRYPKYDLWRDGFYKTLISKTYKALKDGGIFCLQVGSQSYPLKEDGIAIAEQVGFKVVEVRPMGGSNNNGLKTKKDSENGEVIILLVK